MSYQDRLASMNDQYQRAPTAGSDDMPPAGDYQGVIDRFDFIDAKSGRLYLKTEMSVASGPYRGWSVSTLHDLEDPDKLQYLKAHLKALDTDVAEYGDLEAELKGALDAVVEIEIYTTAAGKSYAKVTRRHSNILASDIPPDPIDPSPVKTTGKDGDEIPF